MDTIYFAKVHKDAKMPTRRDEDGCYDLYAAFDGTCMWIPPHTVRLIPTGIISAFGNKYRIAFRERGSNVKPNVAVKAVQIDSGYRGEWFIALRNDSEFTFCIDKNANDVETKNDEIIYPYSKAVCQFAVERVPDVDVRELTPEQIKDFASERGEGKLGSSGK